mgnify:CR=1 FL=1
MFLPWAKYVAESMRSDNRNKTEPVDMTIHTALPVAAAAAIDDDATVIKTKAYARQVGLNLP